MATTEELINNINAQVADINTAAGGMGLESNIKPIAPITPEQMSGEETAMQTDVAIPDMVADTISDVNQTAQTVVDRQQPQDQLTAEVEQRRGQTESAYLDALGAYIQGETDTLSEAEIEDQVYTAKGVDQLERTYTNYQNKLTIMQDNLRTEIEGIYDIPGMTKGRGQAMIAEAERKSLKKQADVALAMLATQGNYIEAKRSADRMVDAMFAREERMSNIRRMMVNEYKDLFTKAEMREFELKEADREWKRETEKNNQKILQDTKLSALQMAQTNGAPQEIIDAISTADSPEEVISFGGQWGSADMLERQYKRAQINDVAFRQQLEISRLAFDRAQAAADQAEKVSDKVEAKAAEKQALIEKSKADVAAAQTAQDIVGKLYDEIAGRKGVAAIGPGTGAFGLNRLGKFLNKQLTPNETKEFMANLDQLRGITTLQSRQALKGSGTITDAEMAVAANAETWLNSENALDAKESAWEPELERLMGVFQNAEMRAKYNAFSPAERAEFGMTMDRNQQVFVNGVQQTTSFEDETNTNFNPANLY